jgi:Ca2+-binding EF-hand superfamily protein
MFRLLWAVGVGLWVSAAALAVGPAAQPKKPLGKLLQGSAEDLIAYFDKNKDGVLTRDELPPRLARAFDRFDTNKDGKLDKKEVEAMIRQVRQFVGRRPGARPAVERMVNNIMQRMDTNNDGKISRQEAKNRIKRFFDQIDTNKDGFVDREELRRFVTRIIGQRRGGNGGRPDAGRPDFDALDRNADGRLTRDELKGTRFEAVFDQIDTNKDGKIDRKEFEAYLKKTGKE